MGQPALLSESLSMAATAENVAGDPVAAGRYLDEADAITPGLDDFPATIELVQSRAIHAFFQADLESARAASLDGVRLSREAGDLYQLEAMLRNLGMVGMMTGDLESAMSRGVEALRVARQIDHRLAQYYGLAGLGWRAASAGQARLAAKLLGAAEVAGMRAGAEIMGPSLPYWAQAEALALAALGPSKFETEFAAGKRMTRDAAVRLALGESGQGEVEAGADVAPGPLKNRELEVAQLVAEGLSNKRIGARLFISEATVATHIRNIMNKLGINSRAQIAGWMASAKR
jgi:DNA-binding CsgD family transcriptional regulator